MELLYDWNIGVNQYNTALYFAGNAHHSCMQQYWSQSQKNNTLPLLLSLLLSLSPCPSVSNFFIFVLFIHFLSFLYSSPSHLLFWFYFLTFVIAEASSKFPDKYIKLWEPTNKRMKWKRVSVCEGVCACVWVCVCVCVCVWWRKVCSMAFLVWQCLFSVQPSSKIIKDTESLGPLGKRVFSSLWTAI